MDTIRSADGDTAVVFVHGILSRAESCWCNDNGAYWPDLLAKDPECEGISIYTFNYRADIFSGIYSLGDAVDSLKENLILNKLLIKKKLIFVCHSMGGIVVREFIVRQQTDLIAREILIGLFLIASPSLGSDYANFTTALARLLRIKNAQAVALRFAENNVWLNDLDKHFNNLKESGRLLLCGKELIEDNFIVLKRFWKKQIVPPYTGARYFGNPFKVPYSDHSTISKPESRDAIQHRLLCQFIKEYVVSAGVGEFHTTTEKPTQKNNCEFEANTKSTTDNNKNSQKKKKNRFRVGLSFPGEYRYGIIEPMADCLARQLSEACVLYDRYYEAEFAQIDLDDYLENLYLNECDLVAVFLCDEYENKDWCGLEWRAVRALIKGKQGNKIMLFRMDDIGLKKLPGLLGLEGAIDVGNRTGEEIASLILDRLEINDEVLGTPGNPKPDPKPTEEQKQAQVETICKLVLKQIASLLENEELLKKKLSERLDNTADVILALCETAKTGVCSALDKLNAATRKTLEKMKADRSPEVTSTHTNASKTMNWLLLLSVDPGWLWRHRDLLVDGVSAQPLVTSAKSEFSADLGFSALKEKSPSRYKLFGASGVQMLDSLNINQMLESGPGETAQLEEIKTALWRIVFPIPKSITVEQSADYEPPSHFGRGEDKESNKILNARIAALRNSEGKDHYCITSVDIHQCEFSRGLIGSLQSDLPGISVLVFGVAGGSKVLLILEPDIQSRIKVMHDMIQEDEP